MNKKIAIIGAGGHGKVVGEIALLNQFKTIDFFDDKISGLDSRFPFKILGTSNDFKNHLKNYSVCFVAIGDNKIRHEKINWLLKLNVRLANLVHPKSTISQYSTLGAGICIMAHAVVNPGTSIGDGAIINTSVSVDHDCIIEEFVHISPNCALSGNVKVGKFTHIGTGSSIHPSIHIGSNVKIGVGAKIYKDIEDNIIFNN